MSWLLPPASKRRANGHDMLAGGSTGRDTGSHPQRCRFGRSASESMRVSNSLAQSEPCSHREHRTLKLSGRPVASVVFRTPTGWSLRAAGSPVAPLRVTDRAWLHRLIELCCDLEGGSSDDLPGCDLRILLAELDRAFQGVPGRDIFDAYYRAAQHMRDRTIFDLTPGDLLFDLEQMHRINKADRKRHANRSP